MQRQSYESVSTCRNAFEASRLCQWARITRHKPTSPLKDSELPMKFLLDYALLPSGWAMDVGIDVADGAIRAVSIGAPPVDRERIKGIALPGLPNVHCHAFQRAMAGLAEARGPASDTFWTWRQVMYRFLGTLTPEDVEAIAAFAYMEMLEAGFTSVGEFHYLHHDVDGRPYTDLGELAARIGAAA